MAVHQIVFFFRRRAVVTTAVAGSLVVLFVLLKHVFQDVDRLAFFAEIDSSAYDTFEVSSLPVPSPPQTPLRPVRNLPQLCLESHFALGVPCHNDVIHPIDILWTWVNGSDILLVEAKKSAQHHLASDDPYRPLQASSQARQFRDHDELRYSMRSVLANFRSHTSRFRLLSADFPVHEVLAETYDFNPTDHWRLGQLPQWLDLNMRSLDGGWHDEDVRLSVVHHAQVFRPYGGSNFNSLAIESQFGNVDDISEYFIYMNDDFFMMNQLTPATFFTSTYGIVLHMQSNLLVGPDKPNSRTIGEWRSLGQTNYLLSQRFGARSRPYVSHEAKVASRALQHELATIWPDVFARTAVHSFRETAAGEGDVYSMWMQAHFVIERSREALLWSWIVGRIGGMDDSWGEEQAKQAWVELGGSWDDRDTPLTVRSGHRDTLSKDRVAQSLQAGGYPPQTLTSYAFSSLDGYPYTNLGSKGQSDWPKFGANMAESALPRCSMLYQECFVDDGASGTLNSASEVFRNVAFRRKECGDCAILGLMRASGRQGLSAFLPLPERTVPPVMASQPEHLTVPHLSLSDDWHTANFTLTATVGTDKEVNVRQWTLELLQRYQFVIGNTPSAFERITTPGQASSALRRLENNRMVALLCINDDVSNEKHNNEVTDVMKTWFEKRWSRKSAWEK